MLTVTLENYDHLSKAMNENKQGRGTVQAFNFCPSRPHVRQCLVVQTSMNIRSKN